MLNAESGFLLSRTGNLEVVRKIQGRCMQADRQLEACVDRGGGSNDGPEKPPPRRLGQTILRDAGTVQLSSTSSPSFYNTSQHLLTTPTSATTAADNRPAYPPVLYIREYSPRNISSTGQGTDASSCEYHHALDAMPCRGLGGSPIQMIRLRLTPPQVTQSKTH